MPCFSPLFPRRRLSALVVLMAGLVARASLGAAEATPVRAADSPAHPAPAAASAPSLVLVLAIDQLRGDYLERFRPHFVAGGFNLLLERGAQFVDAHHRHSVTKTASGHAVILSGVHADISGIIANDWIDRGTLQRINCVDDESVELIGRAAPANAAALPGTTKKLGASPRGFNATTVGDELKIATGGRAKVIGLSSKDRSAILLAGKLGDAAYWMDKGRMISSTYYIKELPAWVRGFNDAGRAEKFFGATWDRLLPVAAYDALQGPDDVAAESAEWGLGRTFPKTLNGGADKLGPVFYDAFECSPYKNEVLAAFARTLIENEKLGQRGVTDLLGLSFSTNDTIGHNYGPHSHEVMDILLRTDRLLADFFAFLDAKVGLRNCTILLTGDHGIPPLPETLKAINPRISTGRSDNALMLKTCEAALNRAFGPLANGRVWLVADSDASMLFQHGVLAEKKLERAAAENVVRDALLTLEFVATAYTRTDLEAGRAAGPFGANMLLSFNRERSGDVLFVFKPYWFDRKGGVNHGTPYSYDTHVPLVWFGVGVNPGVYPQRVGIDDIAPTLARILRLPAPPLSKGHVLF